MSNQDSSHKESQKKWEQSDKGKMYQKEWKNKNKERINAARRKRYEENKEYHKQYRKEHADKFKEYARKTYSKNKDSKLEYQRNLTKQYKQKFLEMYGGVCSCCGESIFDFLTIEHRQGQQKATRRTGLVAYRDAIQEFRPDLYEILCWNCNCAKGKLGYCPHNPPDQIIPYKIHKVDKYNYTKEFDSLGRKYK